MEVDETSEPAKKDCDFHLIRVTGKTNVAEANVKDSIDEINEFLFEEALTTKYS